MIALTCVAVLLLLVGELATAIHGVLVSRRVARIQADVLAHFTIQGSIYGSAGQREVGEEMARALEAYAGIGRRDDGQ